MKDALKEEARVRRIHNSAAPIMPRLLSILSVPGKRCDRTALVATGSSNVERGDGETV